MVTRGKTIRVQEAGDPIGEPPPKTDQERITRLEKALKGITADGIAEGLTQLEEIHAKLQQFESEGDAVAELRTQVLSMKTGYEKFAVRLSALETTVNRLQFNASESPQA